MAKTNGLNGTLVKFMLAGFIAITATLTGVFATSMVDEQDRIEQKQSEHGERLSKLEAFNESVRDDLKLILERVTK